MKNKHLALLLCCLFMSLGAFAQTRQELLKQAYAALENKQYEKSEKLLKQVITRTSSTSKDLPLIYADLGTVQRRLNKEQDALNSYNQALKLAPANPGILNNRVTLKMKMGDYEGALADCSMAIQADSTREDSFINRSVVYKRMKDTIAAVEDLQYIIAKINPQSMPARNNYADVLMARGHLDEAMAIFEELLKEHPNEPVLLLNKGEVLFKQKKYNESLKYLNRALKVNPQYGNAYVVRANLYLDTNDQKKAKADLDKAVSLKASDERLPLLLERCK